MSNQTFKRWNELANIPEDRILGESIQPLDSPLSLLTESPNTDYVSSKEGDIAELVQDESAALMIEVGLSDLFLELSTNMGYSYEAVEEVAKDILNGTFMVQSAPSSEEREPSYVHQYDR